MVGLHPLPTSSNHFHPSTHPPSPASKFSRWWGRCGFRHPFALGRSNVRPPGSVVTSLRWGATATATVPTASRDSTVTRHATFPLDISRRTCAVLAKTRDICSHILSKSFREVPFASFCFRRLSHFEGLKAALVKPFKHNNSF